MSNHVLTTKRLARLSRNQNSEYLAQRRKGRKEIKLPDLAFLASWREQIPFWIATPLANLRKPRKLSTIIILRSRTQAGLKPAPTFCASFAVKLFLFLCVRLRGNMFFVIKNRQIGASICHGFGARNLNYSTPIATIPGHSNHLLLSNALTLDIVRGR